MALSLVYYEAMKTQGEASEVARHLPLVLLVHAGLKGLQLWPWM